MKVELEENKRKLVVNSELMLKTENSSTLENEIVTLRNEIKKLTMIPDKQIKLTKGSKLIGDSQ